MKLKYEFIIKMKFRFPCEVAKRIHAKLNFVAKGYWEVYLFLSARIYKLKCKELVVMRKSHVKWLFVDYMPHKP